jgi:hypothetical protein
MRNQSWNVIPLFASSEANESSITIIDKPEFISTVLANTSHQEHHNEHQRAPLWMAIFQG